MSDTFSDFIQAESTLRISAGTPLELAPKPDGSGFGYRTPVEIAPMPGSATDTAPATVPALDATGAAMGQPSSTASVSQALADLQNSMHNDAYAISQGVQPHGIIRSIVDLYDELTGSADLKARYSTDAASKAPDFWPAPQLQSIVDEFGATDNALQVMRAQNPNAFIQYDLATGRPVAMEAHPSRLFKNHPVPVLSRAASTIMQLLGIESGGMTEFQAAKAGAALAAGAPNASTVNAGINFAQGMPQNNARLHAQRLDKVAAGGEYPGAPKNPRTVLAPPPGTNLPEMVIGRLTTDDWFKRVEHVLTRKEIMDMAQWYDKVHGEFMRKTKNNAAEAEKLMGAWLVSQQNASPADAMHSVLYQYEQLNRGVPIDKVKGKGLPSANAASLAILSGQPVTKGVGQKISDFVDAAAGKSTRSIMADDPRAGSPFVVDVHTGRDTGLVDTIFLNHLRNLGYTIPDGIVTDLGGGGIKGAQYENRARFGQELAQAANDKVWLGRNQPWTPTELQAVGWMALNKLYGNTATGGDVSSSFDRSLRRISMEAAPGAGSPLDKKAGGRYAALPAADQKAINDTMTARALEITNQRLGINLANVVHASGGWERFTNPATVQQGFMSFETAKQAANMLGYLLQQTEVWVNTAKAMTANPKAYAIDLIEVAGQKNLRNDQALVDLFGKLSDADKTHWTGANKTLRDGIIRGYQPIETEDGRVGIRILIDRGGSKIMDYLKNKAPQVLGDVIKQSGYSIEYTIQEAQLYKARNDWTSKGSTNGGNYLRDGRSEARTSDKAQIWSHLHSDRQKLEAEFLGLVDAAERRNGIQPAGKRSGKVKAAGGGAQP